VTKRLLNVNLWKESGANSKGCGLIQEAAIYSRTFSLIGICLFSTKESKHASNLTGKCRVESCIVRILRGFTSGNQINEQHDNNAFVVEALR
jgi:hypothetical protein